LSFFIQKFLGNFLDFPRTIKTPHSLKKLSITLQQNTTLYDVIDTEISKKNANAFPWNFSALNRKSENMFFSGFIEFFYLDSWNGDGKLKFSGKFGGNGTDFKFLEKSAKITINQRKFFKK
jgi:hypothetical protein